MKTLIIIISLLFSSNIDNSDFPIYGKWKLEMIEIDQKFLIPEHRDYFLSISKELLSYNLEINKCWTKDFTVNDNLINIQQIACTEIGGDGRLDSISNYINYRGPYEIKENQLIIITTDSKLYLNRVLDE